MIVKLTAVAVGGAAGSVVRYLLGGWVQERVGPGFPYGTLLINVSGSFVIGLFLTLSLGLAWRDHWRLLIAIGFLGGYTTFSTFSYETLRLLAEGRQVRAALVNVGLSVAGGLAAAYLGMVLGRLLLHWRAS